MEKKNFLFWGIITFSVLEIYGKYDLTVVGNMLFSDGLFRLSIGLIDCLKDQISINYISTGVTHFEEVPLAVQAIAKNHDISAGKVALLLETPWHTKSVPVNYVPNSTIKLAYSMLESTAIPKKWVAFFNMHFDAVIVPDEFLTRVYAKCGVKVPIFTVPCGLYLEDFLYKHSKPFKAGKKFIFGCSGVFSSSKNQKLLIEAFYEAFGNNPNILLKLHGRGGNSEPLLEKIARLGANNIELIQKSFSHADYVSFMSSLDCYVLISKGEGFSITPREALAAGIPCIISNNTAHKTLCKSNFVKAVVSDIVEEAYYVQFGGYHGYKFNCTVTNVQQALSEVYGNYSYYYAQAQKGREWVKQYLYENLKPYYLNLIKPKMVLMGKDNKVTKNYLITNSKKLYAKYISLQRY